MILTLLGTLTDESAKSGLISDPAFRSSLVIASGAMLILAGSLVLKQMKPDQPSNRMLTIVSLASGTVTLLAFMVGVLAGGN